MAAFLWAICPGCGRFTRDGFCALCVAAWPRVRAACRRCGLAKPVALCPRAEGAWHIASVLAPFEYAAPLDGYLHAFKYHGRRALGRAFGLQLAELLGREPERPDALVAMPLHRSRLLERGYNQAREIACVLARALRVPLAETGLRRRLATPTQTGQSAAQRRASVEGAFTADARFAGLSVLVVDDVLTTGATVNAAAAALIAAGAVRVGAVAVARTSAAGYGRNV